MILDGEVVAFDGARPSFQKLQGRMHLASDHAIRRLARDDPVHYIAFDLLYLDGRSLMGLRYDERRARWPSWSCRGRPGRRPRTTWATGRRCSRLTRAQQLEGVIAKRLDGPYTPGPPHLGLGQGEEHRLAPTSSSAAGWPGEGGRSGRLGALVIGIPDEDGVLRYAGPRRDGLHRDRADPARRLLESLATDESPFVGRQPPKLTHLVRPELVARVDFTERTNAGTLRQPSYKGLRDDVAPEDVRFG